MTRKLFGITALLSCMIGISLSDNPLHAQPPTVNQSEPGSKLTTTIYVNNSSDLVAQQLAAQSREKPDPAKLGELKKLVEKAFDERHTSQLEEAKALAAKLAKLQETLKKRQEKKAEIVTRRINQLMGETDDLDWNTPSIGGRVNYNYLTAPMVDYYSHWNAPFKWLIQPTNGTPARPAVNPYQQPISDPTAKPSDPVMKKNVSDLNLPSNNQTEDLKTLEIQLKYATLKLTNAAAVLKQRDSLYKADAIGVERLNEAQFAAEAAKLEVELATRRVEMVKEREKGKILSPSKGALEDIKTLEIQLKIAQVKLSEESEKLKAMQRLVESKAVPMSELPPLEYTVQKCALEVELAERRLEMAKEQKKSGNNPRGR